MDNRNWKSLSFEIRLLSRLVSLTAIANVWLILNFAKFYFYGVSGWDQRWISKNPSWWDQAKAFWDLSLSHYWLWILAAYFIDRYLWPYIFRKEVDLAFD
ncbi:MAG: hypothetical protein AABZ55_14810 [Bdellovibrionota bacterium]